MVKSNSPLRPVWFPMTRPSRPADPSVDCVRGYRVGWVPYAHWSRNLRVAAVAANLPAGEVNWAIPVCSIGGSGVPGLHGVIEATSNAAASAGLWQWPLPSDKPSRETNRNVFVMCSNIQRLGFHRRLEMPSFVKNREDPPYPILTVWRPGEALA